MRTTDEQRILSLLRSPGSQDRGFRLLAGAYGEQLYWKIRAIVVNHDDADDVLQNTFLKIWRSLADFRGDSALSTWLYRIAINESLDFLRHKRPMALGADADHLADRLMADPYFNGDRAQALLQQAIATLPDVQRTVFNLRYFDEMPYAQMSQVLQTSEGALKASYHIAVKKVAQYVKTHS